MSDEIGRPAYLRVADDLRTKIERGELPVGDVIPSTTQLCTTYGVSATVARAAVAELRNEGLLQGQPGKGVYVVATPDAISRDAVQLTDLSAAVAVLRQDFAAATERLEGAATQDQLDTVRVSLEEVRRQVGDVHALLVELYSRTGNDLPRSARSVSADVRRAVQ